LRRREEANGEWSKKPLADWLTHWLELKKPNLEPNSYDWYERRIRLHLIPRLGSRPLESLAPIHVRELLNGMSKSEKSIGEQYKALKTLRGALEEACRLEQVTRNVGKSVKLPKLKHREMRWLSRDQVVAFLDASAQDRLGALYDVLIDSGARPGEAFALHWSDVYWDISTIYITVLPGEHQRSMPTQVGKNDQGQEASSAVQAHDGATRRSPGEDAVRGLGR